jgi:hypothetical protein
MQIDQNKDCRGYTDYGLLSEGKTEGSSQDSTTASSTDEGAAEHAPPRKITR